MNNYTIIDKTSGSLPVVSVSMLTYKHEGYIAQAIEGVLMQKTTFVVVLVIADDCSPDNTRKIIIDYQQRYPARIKLVLQNNNVGSSQNSKSLLDNLNGKYIATCEGDDYWTDPLKLQKQVDFLDEHLEYSMTFHNAFLKYDDGPAQNKAFSKVENRDYSGQELFKYWIVPTASMVFRREVVIHPKFLAILKEKDLVFGDNVILVMSSFLGKAKGFIESMSVYRLHAGGATHKMDRFMMEKMNKQNLLFAKYFPNLKKTASALILKRNFIYMLAAVKNLDLKSFFFFSTLLFKHTRSA